MFKAAVDAAVKRGELPPGVKTEQTWAKGSDARYGEKGAFRTDVVLMEGSKVIAIWDYKTGAGPTISSRRVDALRSAVTPPLTSPTVYFKVLHVPFYGGGS